MQCGHKVTDLEFVLEEVGRDKRGGDGILKLKQKCGGING